MIRNAVRGMLLLAMSLSMGCIDRKFTVTSDPPAAAVYVNGVHVGETPVNVPFLYYGKYNFLVAKEGYETLVQQKEVKTPWYEYPPLDLVTENFLPYNIRDVRRVNFVMPERLPIRDTEVLNRAVELKDRADKIISPNQVVPAPVPVQPLPVQPAPAEVLPTPAAVPSSPLVPVAPVPPPAAPFPGR